MKKVAAWLLLLSCPAWGTITFTRAGGTRDGAGTTSNQVTVPAAGHAAGSLVGACMIGSVDPGTTTAADSKGNTWTVDQNFWDAGNFSAVVIAHSVLTNALVSGDTITLTSTNSEDSQVYTAEFASSGTFTAAADTSNHNSNGFGGTWVTGSVTPTGSASVVLLGCVASDSNSTSSTPTTNWTEDLDHNGVTSGRGIVFEHRIVASASGSYNEGGTWAANNDGPAAVVVIKESAGGGAKKCTLALMGAGPC